jgi:hypothetical protein
MDGGIMHVRSILTRMTRTAYVAFIGGTAGVAVAVAMGHGSFLPSATAVSAAGSSVVQPGDVGWNSAVQPGDVGWNSVELPAS